MHSPADGVRRGLTTGDPAQPHLNSLSAMTRIARSSQLLDIARELAAAYGHFHKALGPGDGDRNTGSFMADLRHRALEAFGEDYSERAICGNNGCKVDFYFPEEQTIVEVALGLPNPNCEFEKDILKALMAQELGHPVNRLMFISRAGAAKKSNQPARAAFAEWAKTHHALTLEVHELGGQPRRRVRARTRTAPIPLSD